MFNIVLLVLQIEINIRPRPNNFLYVAWAEGEIHIR